MKCWRLPARCSARLPAELVTPGSVDHTLSSSGNRASSRLKPSSSRTRLSEKSTAVRLTAGLDERPGAHLRHRLTQLGVRVHDDRAVPRDGLFDGLAGHEKESDALVARLHGDFVAAVEEDERTVLDVVAGHGGDAAHAVGLHHLRLG